MKLVISHRVFYYIKDRYSYKATPSWHYSIRNNKEQSNAVIALQHQRHQGTKQLHVAFRDYQAQSYLSRWFTSSEKTGAIFYQPQGILPIETTKSKDIFILQCYIIRDLSGAKLVAACCIIPLKSTRSRNRMQAYRELL